MSYGGYQGRDFNGRGRFNNGRSRTLRWKRQLEYGYSNNNNQYRNGGMNMNECPSPFVVRKGIPKSTAITGITFLLIIHCRWPDLWKKGHAALECSHIGNYACEGAEPPATLSLVSNLFVFHVLH